MKHFHYEYKRQRTSIIRSEPHLIKGLIPSKCCGLRSYSPNLRKGIEALSLSRADWWVLSSDASAFPTSLLLSGQGPTGFPTSSTITGLSDYPSYDKILSSNPSYCLIIYIHKLLKLLSAPAYCPICITKEHLFSLPTISLRYLQLSSSFNGKHCCSRVSSTHLTLKSYNN